MPPPQSEAPDVQLAALANQKVGSGKEQETLSNIALREKVARNLLILFIVTNAAVLLAIGSLATVDYHVSSRILDKATTQPVAFEKLLGSPELIEKTRSVNSAVLMTLIGATTVQVGAGVLTMTQYLFPKQAST